MQRFLRMQNIVAVMIAVGLVSQSAPASRLIEPEQVKEKITKLADADWYGEAECVVVLDNSDATVDDIGLATTDRQLVVKILKESGIKSQAVHVYGYDPLTNIFDVTAARIYRRDGTIEEIPMSSVVTRVSPQHWMYWGGDQHILGFPRLEVGDAIEIQTRKRGYNIAYLSGETGSASGGGERELIPPMPGHWYETHYFEGDRPIAEIRYTVRLPKDKPIQFEVYHGTLTSSVRFTDDHHVYSWEATEAPPFKKEPHMEAFSDCACKLVMATLGCWEAKARWFHDANEKQFEANDEIRELVAKLIDGVEDEDRRLQILNSWVADNIRYVGTSRGPCEGFTLHTGIETIRDLGGVCKDKAGMLITMLRAAGYDSYPVLTQAGSEVEVIPADQFNHTVVCIRYPDGRLRLLDPTWSPDSRELWSSREAEQYVVYGVPEGLDLAQSPYFSPEQNRLCGKAESTVRSDGKLISHVRFFDLEGYPDTYLRRSFAYKSKPDQPGVFEKGVTRVACNAQLLRASHNDILDLSKSGTAEVTLSAEGYAFGDNGVQLLRLPMMSHPCGNVWIPDFFYGVDAKERKWGYRMRATRLIKYEETINLPEGWTVQDMPEDKTIDNDAAALKFAGTCEGSRIHYTFEFTLKKQIIPADEYAGFKEAIDAMNEIGEAWVVCRTDSGTSVASKDIAGQQEVINE